LHPSCCHISFFSSRARTRPTEPRTIPSKFTPRLPPAHLHLHLSLPPWLRLSFFVYLHLPSTVIFYSGFNSPAPLILALHCTTDFVSLPYFFFFFFCTFLYFFLFSQVLTKIHCFPNLKLNKTLLFLNLVKTYPPLSRITLIQISSLCYFQFFVF